jgi:hypothetical protein
MNNETQNDELSILLEKVKQRTPVAMGIKEHAVRKMNSEGDVKF